MLPLAPSTKQRIRENSIEKAGFCPRVPVHKNRYKRPNNTPHITNESQQKRNTMDIPLRTGTRVQNQEKLGQLAGHEKKVRTAGEEEVSCGDHTAQTANGTAAGGRASNVFFFCRVPSPEKSEIG